MKRNKPNVGHINFLNCLPLTYGFSRGHEDLTIVADMPANLNRAVVAGNLDISPVSSIVYALNSDRLLLLPDVSITADGDVQSIILVSRQPITELDRHKIVLTAKSATSHCLLKIIMKKAYGAEPQYEIRAVGASSGIPDDAAAVLLIGDDALFVHHHPEEGLFYYDLGREWKRLTGTRMVYAVWVVRKAFAETNPVGMRAAYHAISDGFRYGCAHKNAAIASISETTSFTPEQLRDYLTVIQWDFAAEHHLALLTFYQMAQELGLLPDVPELTIAEVAR